MILELGGGYEEGVLRAHRAAVHGRPLPDIRWIGVDGAGNDFRNARPRDVEEVYLDIEIAAALAPDAQFVVYFAEKTVKGLIDMFKQAIHAEDSQGAIISLSWGANEILLRPSDIDILDNCLADALSLGITVCASTGDTGSSLGAEDSQAYVEYPASSPHVLACAGSSLSVREGRILKETVWNNSFGASGGGVSAILPVPDYQAAHGIIPTHVATGLPGRGTADVCGHADPAHGYLVHAPYVTYLAGTSAVAPMWAALVALFNEKLDTRLGFVNPWLYRIAHDTQAFHDITEGKNDTGTSKGYAAAPGWDACSGLGSPRGRRLQEALRALLHGSGDQHPPPPLQECRRQ